MTVKLYLVYVGAAFPNVVLAVVLVLGTIHSQQSCSFVLCPQTTLVASEDCFGIKPKRPIDIIHVCQPYLKGCNMLCSWIFTGLLDLKWLNIIHWREI